jgi:PPK2 family polyphosphate:nucleotide phosphotransferase
LLNAGLHVIHIKHFIMMEFVSNLENLDKDSVVHETKKLTQEIGDLQYKMYAEKKHSILIVLQGLDASGKDGLVKDLLEFCNPVGLSVYSFKKPSLEEYSHDFLWRVHKQTPAKGILQVFIRSHYEDILVPTVEGFIPAEIIEQRYDQINQFEKLIEQNGTKIIKFLMAVSEEQEKERLNERVTNPEKHWKHNDGDWDTLKKREQYLQVYHEIYARCNVIPWHIIPSDKNWQKTWVSAQILLKVLQDMNLQWPALESELFTT